LTATRSCTRSIISAPRNAPNSIGFLRVAANWGDIMENHDLGPREEAKRLISSRIDDALGWLNPDKRN